MIKKFLSAATSLIVAVGLIVGSATASQAATVSCSGGGSFSITGTVVDSSTNDCAGTVVIPSDVTEIATHAFAQRLVTGVTFASNSALTTIGDHAFYYSKVASVAIPSSVTTIGDSAFYYNPQLTSLTFEPGSHVTLIDQYAFYYTGITSVVIPASVATIAFSAFAGWPTLSLGLRSATFESGSLLTTIGVNAFGNSYFTSITLPAGVTSIDWLAFADNPALVSIVFTGNAPATVHDEAFLRTGLTQVIQAVRASTLTGFGANGSTWKRLVVAEPAVPCAVGTYSSSGNAPCDPAPAGRFVAATGAVSATPCPPGTYQNQTGQSACVAATAGHYVNISGATSQLACAAGYYQSATGQSSCTAASAGFYVDSVGAVSQTVCPVGSTSVEASVACIAPVSMPISAGPIVPKPKSLTLSGFGSSATVLTAAMKAQTKAFVMKNKTLTKLKCVGDVAGVAKGSAQVKLANARAKQACAYAKSLNKSLTVSYSGKQSKTYGKISRSVALTLAP